MTAFEDADSRLMRLMIDRGRLAQLLDCYLQCGCSPTQVKCQVVLDKILYDTDRAIDLYAVGKDDFGDPERRAAAYSFIIEEFKTHAQAHCNIYGQSNAIGVVLDGIMNDRLRPPLSLLSPDVITVKDDLLRFSASVLNELTIKHQCPLHHGTIDVCVQLDAGAANSLAYRIRVEPATLNLGERSQLFAFLEYGRDVLRRFEGSHTPGPSDFLSDYLSILSQELRIQMDMEGTWANLVKTMAPDCVGITSVLDALKTVVKGAVDRVSSGTSQSFEVTLPPHFETTLDGLVENVLPDGTNR